MKKALSIILIIAMSLSMVACSKKGGDEGTSKTIDLNALHEKVKEAYGEDYLATMPVEKEMMKDRYGLTEDMYEEIIADVPMISVHVDEFVAVKAKADKLEDVKKALTDYQTKYKEDTMQYPINLPKIQASQVVTKGDYVFFLMLGVIPTSAEEQGEDAMLKAAEENNNKAIEVINSFFE
ncbi:MAG: DUF4358 domain-containing protein [Lachnospiraceae bacterium]